MSTRPAWLPPSVRQQALMPDWKRDEARRMRKAPTPAEAALWEIVRGKRLGVRIHRQATMWGYIADFWCVPWKLVIEVDGSVHEARRAEDATRDRNLAARGIRTLRLTNDEVLRNDPRQTALKIISFGLQQGVVRGAQPPALREELRSQGTDQGQELRSIRLKPISSTGSDPPLDLTDLPNRSTFTLLYILQKGARARGRSVFRSVFPAQGGRPRAY